MHLVEESATKNVETKKNLLTLITSTNYKVNFTFLVSGIFIITEIFFIEKSLINLSYIRRKRRICKRL